MFTQIILSITASWRDALQSWSRIQKYSHEVMSFDSVIDFYGENLRSDDDERYSFQMCTLSLLIHFHTSNVQKLA